MREIPSRLQQQAEAEETRRLEWLEDLSAWAQEEDLDDEPDLVAPSEDTLDSGSGRPSDFNWEDLLVDCASGPASPTMGLL